ncbi:MAG: response regulator [Candidatus Scalindua sp.]|nr:response regulator [Candidatus Scalindua sp.]
MQLRVLFVEDSQDDLESTLHELRNGNYNSVYERVSTSFALITALDSQSWDVIIIDYSMQNLEGVDVLKLVQERELFLPCIIVSDVKGEDFAVEAMKAGATDYIMKDNLKKIVSSVELALKKAGEWYRKKLELAELIKFKTLLDNLNDLSYMCDTKGNILYVNKIFEKLSGHKKKEFFQKSFIPLFEGESLEKAKNLYSRTLKGESPVDEIYFKDTGILCEYKNIPMRDKKGNITGVIGIARDITKRKQLEKRMKVLNRSLKQEVTKQTSELIKSNEKLKKKIHEHKRTENALRKNEKWLRGIFASLHETSIAVFGREGYIISLWGTPVLDERYGLRSADVVGKKINELLPPEQAKKRVAEHNEVFDTGENKIVEYQITFPRGDFWHEVSLCPLKDTGSNITAIVGFIRDITDRKQREEKILQSEKLKAMGVMTSGITHEFNNILAIIKGFTLLLKEKYGDHKEVIDKISIILKSVDDGVEIVNRMQEFTRSEVDRSELKPVDVREILEQVIEFSMPRLKTISEANGITYYIDRKGMRKVPEVSGNSTELREVILNIINNSLDAMPEGGRLTLRTCKKDDRVIMSISDTGEGMGEDVLKNIFDPFFTTKSPKGTGLGMSVSYGIIKRHGGKIEVISRIGKGSTITIRLPVSNNTSNLYATDVTQKQEPGVMNLNILVVDDEQAVCELLVEFLSQEGHKVKSVCCGSEAIKLLKMDSFDLVLCDLVMPDISGRGVIKILDTLDKRPKVGLITGWSEKIQPSYKEDLKVDFIVKKPFSFSELSKEINDVFCIY